MVEGTADQIFFNLLKAFDDVYTKTDYSCQGNRYTIHRLIDKLILMNIMHYT